MNFLVLLGYACAVHYRYTRLVKKLQPGYDRAWKTLVDSNVLRPSETEEYVCDMKFAFQCQSEREQAQKAVKAAEAVVISVQEAGDELRDSRLTPPARLQIAQSRLDVAKEFLESIKRRNDLTTDFKRAARNYLIAKEDVDQHNAKLRWILEQVPLVEAELRESETAEGGSHTRRSTKRRRHEISSFVDGSARSHGPERVSSEHSRRDDTAYDERPSKRLRKTQSGGITKLTPRNKSGNTRSQGSATTLRKEPTSNHGPNRPKQAPVAPDNTCKCMRSSRRLAGDPPEFGNVQERRGALPLYERYLQQHLTGSRRNQQPGKGAKPQGISRSREIRTASGKGLAERLS
jgi:hypothetical protein